VLKPIKAKAIRRRSSTEVAADNYAFEEYGLKPAEMARAANRIRAEVETARSRGELKRFSGDIKSLILFDAKKS
jgi:hypothetical protein